MASKKSGKQQDSPQLVPSQQRKGTPIEYKEYLKHDTYVTGIAYYSNPDGLGNFRIYVSGSPEAVDSFAREASILSMQIAPEDDKDVERMDQLQAEAFKVASELRHRQREAVKILADKDRSGSLSEEERRELQVAAAEPQAEHDSHKPNFTRDREIQIEVLDKLDPKTPYTLSFHIDPPVARGTCDIWYLYDGNYTAVGATMVWTGGNPDLYLYLNGNMVSWSTLGPGAGESVYAWGGPGEWRLHVFGRDDGNSYEIVEVGRWAPVYDDIPDTH